LEQVRDFVKMLAPDKIVKCNQEILVIQSDQGDLRKLSSFPACARTLRGQGGDVIYMEEGKPLCIWSYFFT